MKHPIYVDESGQLYAYEESTGRLWYLHIGDYAGEVGKPMPGAIQGKGAMTMIGMHHLGD